MTESGAAARPPPIRGVPLAILAIGLALSVAVLQFARDLDLARVESVLELRAEWRARDLEHKVRLASATVGELADYIAVQPTLDAESVRRFAGLAHGDTDAESALLWAPLVAADRRAAFIAQTRRDGPPDFEIVERGPGGAPVPAAARDLYLPGLFEVTFDGRPGMPGRDYLYETERRLRVEQARDEGRPIATPPLSVYAGGSEQLGFLVYWPVFATVTVLGSVADRRAALRGMAIGRFYFDRLLETATSGTPPIVESLDVLVDAGRTGAPAIRVAGYDPVTGRFSVGGTPQDAAADGLTLTRDFENLGRKWTIISHFSPASVAALRTPGPWAWFAAGLVLTALVALFAGREQSRRFRVEALVHTRTVELVAANAALSQEMADRRRSEAQFRGTFEQAAVGLAHVALDGSWLRLNDRFCEITGYQRAVLERLSPLAITRPEDRPVFHAVIDRLLAGEISRLARDEQVLCADGSFVWGRVTMSLVRDESGQPAYFVKVLEDIAEVKAAELALRASEQRLRGAIQGPGVGIAEQDLDLRYTYIDAVFPGRTVEGVQLQAEAAFLGRTDEEVHGAGHPFIATKRAVLASGVGTRTEIEFRVDQGSLVFEVWIEPRRSPDGIVTGLLCSFIDITQRRNTEQQLQQSLKMEAIGNLTGGLAHDFNNLLAVVLGSLDDLRRAQPLNEEADGLVRDAMTAAESGADLTRRLLAFARRQPLAPRRLEPNALLGELARLMRRTLGENVEIALDPAADAWPIVADPVQLEAAILNLATNARDAMPEGGRLTIATSNRHLDADYARQAGDTAPGDYVMVEVSDTGIGIDPTALRHIFEPFYTTKERGRGTGLGLAMVFGFVKQSGGHINVYSEPGAGTTFRLYLPRAQAADTAAAEDAPRAIPRGAGETILVVEDNLALRRLVLRQLSGLGYRVLEAEDVAGALAVLEREPVDLVFTDVMMPGGADGAELVRRVMARWPATRAILTSGFPEGRVENAFAGALSEVKLLIKPYRREELARVVHGVLHAGPVG